MISISDRKILSVTPTPPNGTPAEFERVWPWLSDSLDAFYGPLYRKRDIAKRIADNRAGLWTTNRAAIVGNIVGYPTGIDVFNYWIQGPSVEACKEMHAGIEAWAKQRGCSLVSGHGREGWIRVMEGDWQKGPVTRYKWL